MKGKRLSDRELTVFQLAATGYTPAEIADLRRTSLALRKLYLRACEASRTAAEEERDEAKEKKREREIVAIVAARNQRRFEELGTSDSQQAEFQDDPRGGAVILHGANGWTLRP